MIQVTPANVQGRSLTSSERPFSLVNQQLAFRNRPPKFVGIRGKVGVQVGVQLTKSLYFGKVVPPLSGETQHSCGLAAHALYPHPGAERGNLYPHLWRLYPHADRCPLPQRLLPA